MLPRKHCIKVRVVFQTSNALLASDPCDTRITIALLAHHKQRHTNDSKPPTTAPSKSFHNSSPPITLQFNIKKSKSRGSVLAFSTQVRGFKPGRSRRIFKDEKILSTPSFGGEVKPSVPCRRFAECNNSLNGVEVVMSAKLQDNILAHSSHFRRGGRGGTW
jgi:hypothetical protein